MKELVSFAIKFPTTRCPSITVLSAIVCSARAQECLIESICCIVLRAVLEKRSDQKSIRGGLGGNMGSRDEAVIQYKRSKNKQKKELKALMEAEQNALQNYQEIWLMP